MAFIKETKILTDSGWKNIEDISGRDKVLVRNFLGDAEFIQPFALKKKNYEGKVVKIGARHWSFTVTPDHIVVYDKKRAANGRNFEFKPAGEMIIRSDYRIYRKFKYMFPETPNREMIKVWDEFGKRTVTISDYDWYKLVAFVLCRGFIRMKPGRPMLFIFLDEKKMEQEVSVLGDLLDRIGVGWHVQHSDKTTAKIVVSSKNTLAARLKTRLGSTKRKEMYLPDKMIYNSSKELTNLLVETIVELAVGEDAQKNQIVTTNKALIDSLTLLGTLGGYGIYGRLLAEAGRETIRGVTKKDSYIMVINRPTDTYAPSQIKKIDYSGPVYEIDLFEGQVYVSEGSMPVWVNPK